jgi:hypothetical protein
MNAPQKIRRERIALWAIQGSLLVAAIMLGGSIYEGLVVDAAWPTNVAIIQPDEGGVNRKAFWIPLHVLATLLLPLALWASWRERHARRWLLVALGSYAAIRIWSSVYFIPAALDFETAMGLTDASMVDAQRWVLLSWFRTPLALAVVVGIQQASRRFSTTPIQ